MKIVIDIPDNEVPKRREIVEIGLQFMGGEVCECTYPFQILPKGHGRLIDADVLADEFEDNYEFCEVINATPTIIEADKEAENG